MRLYSRTGAVAIDDPQHGHIEPGPDGGFDLPEELAVRLRGFAVRGARQWEDDIERQHRLMDEELERRKDPATLLEAVEQLVQASRAVSAPPAKAAAKSPSKAATAKAAAKP